MKDQKVWCVLKSSYSGKGRCLTILSTRNNLYLQSLYKIKKSKMDLITLGIYQVLNHFIEAI